MPLQGKSTLLIAYFLSIVCCQLFLTLAVVVVEAAQQNPVRPTSGCTIKSVTGPITEPDGLSRIRHAGDIPQLVDTDARTFACVDARTEHSVVGALGGDIGEFLTGLDTFRRLCDENLPEERIVNMLKKFVDAHTTPLRPFYMHTDNTSMVNLLNAMGADSFPTTEPDAETKKKWFDTLFQSTTRYHGCGHLWYQYVALLFDKENGD